MEILLIFIGVILFGIWIALDRILTAVKKINGDIPARDDDENGDKAWGKRLFWGTLIIMVALAVYSALTAPTGII